MDIKDFGRPNVVQFETEKMGTIEIFGYSSIGTLKKVSKQQFADNSCDDFVNSLFLLILRGPEGGNITKEELLSLTSVDLSRLIDKVIELSWEASASEVKVKLSFAKAEGNQYQINEETISPSCFLKRIYLENISNFLHISKEIYDKMMPLNGAFKNLVTGVDILGGFGKIDDLYNKTSGAFKNQRALDALARNAIASSKLTDLASSLPKQTSLGISGLIDNITARETVRPLDLKIPPNPAYETNKLLQGLEAEIKRMGEISAQTAQMQSLLNDATSAILATFSGAVTTFERNTVKADTVSRRMEIIAVASLVISLIALIFSIYSSYSSGKAQEEALKTIKNNQQMQSEIQRLIIENQKEFRNTTIKQNELAKQINETRGDVKLPKSNSQK